MEKPKRARKRKLETSQGGPGATSLWFSGGQGVHREVESEGHEKKYRAVIDGGNPDDEPVGQRWGKVEPALWRRRRFLIHPPQQGVCGRHGTEDLSGPQEDSQDPRVALREATLSAQAKWEAVSWE